jgi:uncharacterized protein (TIGR02270 family)
MSATTAANGRPFCCRTGREAIGRVTDGERARDILFHETVERREGGADLKPVVMPVIEQHRDEAGFLWILRSQAVGASHFTLEDLCELEERLEAHLEGLRIAGEAGWRLCEESLGRRDPGDIFAAAVLAIENADAERLEAVLTAATEEPELARAVSSALAWHPWQTVEAKVARLLGSDSTEMRCIGIAASALHRVYRPAEILKALEHESAALRARAIQAVGELGCREMLPRVIRHLADEEAAVSRQAAWAGALLGDPGARTRLIDLSSGGGPGAEADLALIAGFLPLADARAWLQNLRTASGGARLAVEAAGKIGDPALVDWLIDCMAAPELARTAAEAMRTITDADISDLDLEGEPPPGFEAGPSENPEDDDVALDPDEDLPWPEPERVAGWWQANRGRFPGGVRHLAGRPVSAAQCVLVLQQGRQRQRIDAAIQSLLLSPGQPLFEVRAPGRRQKRLLGLAAAARADWQENTGA